ncbi:MAG: hypothetical protein CML43_10190 [Rhodobacteraceae bacterium]|nr:hypothetical protein [Paracoccaceae bacterium]
MAERIPPAARSRRRRRIALGLLALALPGAAAGYLAGFGSGDKEAVFAIEAPDRPAGAPDPAFGAVLGAFGGGGAFSAGGGFERPVFRTLASVASDAPPARPGLLRADAGRLLLGGVLRAAALEGAQVSVLRLRDGVLTTVREGEIPRQAPAQAAGQATAAAPEEAALDLGPGPRLLAGDLAILRAVIDPATAPSPRGRAGRVGPRELRPGPLPIWPDEDPSRQWRLRPLGPDEGGGPGNRTALSVTLAAGAALPLILGRRGGTGQDFYPVLRPDEPYALSARLRGDRPGAARLRLGPPYDAGLESVPSDGIAALPFGRDWAQVETRFTLPSRDDGDGSAPVMLVLSAPADAALTVEIDDLRLRRAAAPWMGLAPEDLAKLRAFAPGTLRFHAMSKSRSSSYALETLLSEGGTEGKRSQRPGLPASLRLAGAVGAAPWLQIEPHFSDAEWLGLAEYLAAPFDPADPGARPWAALRAAQGREAPWTEAFDRIWLELGNETWNGLMAPWVFPAMPDAATGAQAEPGTVYGLFQKRVAGILRGSPWWGALEGRVGFVIGGWARFDYGARAAAAAGPEAADMLAIAGYNGGWDDGAKGPATPNARSFYNILNNLSEAAGAAAARNADQAAALSQARGAPLIPGVYEAGPGYALNGLGGARVTPRQERLQEEAMKSRAAGVATLDAFLARRAMGYGPQLFFTFDEGVRWRSHAAWHLGGAAYPAWALLGLANHEFRGADLPVRTISVPRGDVAGRKGERVDDAPLVAVYAALDGEDEAGPARLAVVAISRRVPGAGPDRNAPADSPQAACTPLRIRLPEGWSDPARLTLHRMGGTLASHGADGLPPRIETQALSPEALRSGTLAAGAETGTPACGLPPGSAWLWVLERG